MLFENAFLFPHFAFLFRLSVV
uniref:Uncharacterized protein n=1 Tax=Anguilla anguilla TaxID=7936 RepID=A0A0E9XU08_ANGAN